MRNLKLVSVSRVGDAFELQGTRHVSVDYDTGRIYCATSTGIVALDPLSKQVDGEIDLVTAGYLRDGVSVIGLQHLPDQMAVCAATSSGDVLLWSPGCADVECVGSVESGLVAMAWSPDHELVVMVTGVSSLIMMTREFDPVSEVNFESGEFGDAAFVNAGWGKKETQFHGSVGKEAASQVQAAISAAANWDDKLTRVSWCGDGQMFAVSTIDSTSRARCVRVWSRECVLHSTSEPVDGLEQALSWKPSGSIIASVQRRPNKHEVVFFEQNGLRHGEFELPYAVKDVNVREMCWNSDSNILAVWLEDLPQGDAGEEFIPRSYVDLWTVNNYHWYRKQHLPFAASSEQRIAAITWDPEQAYRLHIICAGGQYLSYTYAWSTDSSPGLSSDDPAAVAVIDGHRVLITPFRHMVVPPPMCAYYLQLPAPVNQLSWSCDGLGIAVLMSDGRLAMYKHQEDAGQGVDESVKLGAAGGNGFSVCTKLPRMFGTYNLCGDDTGPAYPCQQHHLSCLFNDMVVYSQLDDMGSMDVLYLAQIQSAETIDINSPINIDGYHYSSAVHEDTSQMVIQLADGALRTFLPQTKSLGPFTVDGHAVKFPMSCSQMALATFAGQLAVIGLTDRFRFYINETEIASNVTSFYVHDEFLLLSTHTHTVRCISRTTPVHLIAQLTGDRAHFYDESVRRVERGSRIVTSPAVDTRLVLQMPRGNLEVIHPRALVLATIKALLDKLQYSEAFTLMRRHRLNLNLLCDHDRAAFLSNVANFIKQINTVTHINLFLSDLQEEDITVTMYNVAYQRKQNQVESKVDSVCDAMRIALEAADPDKFLLCILTSHVKKARPELSVALQRIKTLRDKTVKTSQTVSAAEALTYLIFLVDVNELYDIALGTYDFDLVIMVAEKSQKDPKEYLPFLNSLRKMDAKYQQFTIDRHLKRHALALEHISACEGEERFTECLALVNEQRLYARALQLYKCPSTEYTTLSEEYADYLSGKRHHTEAGVILLRAGCLASALKQYELAADWRQVMCLCARLQYSSEEIVLVARRMAVALGESHRALEAGSLLEQYAGDVEEAVAVLVSGHEWCEASRLMYRHQRIDLAETHLHPAVKQAAQDLHTSCSNAQKEFCGWNARLCVVRQQKEEAARIELEEAEKADNDLFSDTSSATGMSDISASSRATSRFTTDTQRTSQSGTSGKSRRKAQRKKWSLKEGSRNEDLALIEVLHKGATQAEAWKGEVSALLAVLVELRYDQLATDLQCSLDTLLHTVTKALPEIWPSETDIADTLVSGPQSTSAAIAEAVRSGKAVTSSTEPQLDAAMRVAPPVNIDTRWQLHMLRPNNT